ncbi:MAG: type IV pilus twitching motility protein PilT [Acidobacteriota bacterium]
MKIHALFDQMMTQRASDLHMVVGLPPMFRIHGELYPAKHPPLTQAMSEEYLFALVDEEKKKKFLETHDIDFAYAFETKARFRVNFFEQYRGMGAVFRLIPTAIVTPDDLGLPPSIVKMTEAKKGLILVTGPTGSGKSTTLACMIDVINRTRQAHILTIEDPIEFVHENKKCLITQRELGAHTESFGAALRVAGRQDPDIILIGEMRDLETIALALTSAELGLLVFATLHTNSAAKTIDRIVDVFPFDQQDQVRGMLAESLKGVIAQQLLKTKDGKGRVGAFEVLVGSPALGNLIREKKSAQVPSMIQTGGKVGMQSMDQHLEELVKVGKITSDEARMKAHDKEKFQS